ncbi:hypothetical protein D1AOALGA4SA_7930 [Olavius algarvensis Delta 1 endosymbiont]|nr:hypothetical protein D1AOALGA4SA_7930 [Olavius algarvensis Delta 1 endosymbiont]
MPFYFVAEYLVLPPGCRPYPPGRKLGQLLIPCSLRGSDTIGYAICSS